LPKTALLCDYFAASSTATATATDAPTIGLLPMPMRPIISTCAGTEEEPKQENHYFMGFFKR